MKKTLLFLLFFLQFSILFAQNPDDVGQDYGAYPGFNGIVDITVIQPDGKMLVAGNFTSYLGNSENYLIRLNKDGSKDTSFNIGTGFNRNIESIILQPDGKILAGGNFTTFNGITQNRIIRLNPDGSKDTSFNVGTGITDSYIATMALQPDGKIVVGGYFNYFQNQYQNRLIRLNSDGTKDTSFVGNQTDGAVLSIVVQPDGKIILGGAFRNFQGVSQNLLIRLNSDGTKDSSFDIGTGFERDISASYGSVNTVVLQPDGKIVVGGDFEYFQKTLNRYIVRLNPNGSIDPSFNTESKLGRFGYVQSILAQPDGKIVVGGDFDEYAGQNDPQNRLIRFNADGTKDKTFEIGTGFNEIVRNIAIQDDGQLIIVGVFTTFQNTTQNRLIRLNSNGSKDFSFNKTNGLDYQVDAVTIQNDGKIIAGGKFTTYNGSSQNNLIRFNTNGTKDSSFTIGSGFTNDVNSINIQPDGKIIVGGSFGIYDGTRQIYLTRLERNGYRDSSFNVEPVIQSGSFIALQSDGKILVGKDFSARYQEGPQKGLIRLNSNGSNDNSFEVGTLFGTGIIYAIAVQDDGKIIAGGYFPTTKGAVQNHLIRLNSDGTRDSSFNIGSGFDASVSSVNIQTDGKILVGGSFTTYQGATVKRFIRLNSDGSKDNSFDVGNEFNNTGAYPILQKDGKIILGLIRLNSDGSKDNSFNIGITGFNDSVYCTALQPDGQIVVGGNFTKYKQDTNSAYLIRLRGTYNQTPIIPTITQKNVTCSTAGSASVVVYGGKSPYTYLWSNGGTTESITGLTANSYSCKITDADLTSVTVNFTIATDDDTQNPTIIAPSNITANVNSNCGTTGLILGTPVTSDNCTVSSVTNDAPTIFIVGKTTVTWTVKDGNNNVSTATQIVTVKDVTPPTIKAPSNVSVNANLNCNATGVLLGSPLTSDNCTVSSVINDAPKAFPIGNTTVTWTAKDASNNIATATQIVTVKDITPPNITAPSNIIINTTSNCTAFGVLLGTAITSDNCTVSSVTNDAPTIFPIGNTTVTWTVKDANNNTTTATQIVTVKGLDLTVTYNNSALSVAETGAVYKWLTCDNGVFTTITNETNSTLKLQKSGSYAVEVTKNGCTLTSNCFEVKTLGTGDFDAKTSLKLYPNPTKDFVTIEMNASEENKLKVFDVNGQVVLSKELKTNSTTVNISNFASGVYLFEISNESGSSIKKVIKK